jgi:hypothetical protein
MARAWKTPTILRLRRIEEWRRERFERALKAATTPQPNVRRTSTRLWVAKYKSGGDRSLKQTAAMSPPRVVVKQDRNS